MSVAVEVDTSEVTGAVGRLRGLLRRIAPWEDVKDAAVAAAVQVAPVAAGALVASIRGRTAGAAVEVVAGSALVVYAGVQNYGWPGRNIAARPFLPPAGEVLAEQGPLEVADQIQALIRRVGL